MKILKVENKTDLSSEINSSPENVNRFWDIIKNEFTLTSEYLSDIEGLSTGLPNGVFYKKYTGLGATYCELKASRDSIIVFPFIKLAWEKHQNYASYYVGTRPDAEKVTEKEIAEKIKSHPKGTPIKFCVVAESIEKVINGIKIAGKDPYKDFFLVLDEVEILQVQSGLRDKLPICFEYFLDFEKKCLLSATMIKFTSPEIEKLETFSVDVTYENKNPLNVQRYTGEPHLSLANEIIRQINLEDSKKEPIKFLIGLNSTKGISQMISVFENAGITDLSVLCGDGSKVSFAKKHTSKGIEKHLLPARINFATSAYWNGIDIKERYYPYAVSLNTKLHHLFTYENIIQFVGRCRLKKNNPTTLVLPKIIREDFKIDPIKATDRIEDLNGLIESLEKKIRSKIDRKTINKALTNSTGGLIYKSIKDGKPKANFLLADFELYKQETISRLKNNGESLSQLLGDYFYVKDRGFKKVEITVQPDSDETIIEKKLDNFLSYLDENYSDFSLIDHIEQHWFKTIKVAAFWYLFGRKVLKDEKVGLDLATKFSKNDKDCISLSNTLLDGIRFYTYHHGEFDQFLKSLKGGREGNMSGKDFVAAIENRKHHFPHISGTAQSKSTKSGNFLRYFFGIESKKIGGLGKFKINQVGGIIDGGLKAFFFNSKYAMKVLDNLNQESKPNTKLSKTNINALHIINFEL
jgi:hypothetical protein